MSRRNDGLTCTAKAKTTGLTCGNPPIRGGTVCKIHGGAAPQVKAASARRVLEALVGPALVEMRNILRDPSVPPAVRLAAARDILDRTGYRAPLQVEVITMDAIEREIVRLEAELEAV